MNHLNTHMVCTNAWDQLISLTPPELTHYYHNDHPGASWWLKCAVCESNHTLLSYWQYLQQELPEQVLVRPQAWDWQGDLIPACHSVWIHTQVDVNVTMHQGLWQHQVLTYAQGMAKFITNMREEMSKIPQNTTWHDMQEALHLMNTHVSDREARMRRKQFGVIHGKKATSHKRARPNLDPEQPR